MTDEEFKAHMDAIGEILKTAFVFVKEAYEAMAELSRTRGKELEREIIEAFKKLYEEIQHQKN